MTTTNQPTLEAFLGETAWDFVKMSPIRGQIEALWQKMNTESAGQNAQKDQIKSQILSQIKFVIASQIVPTQIIIKKNKDEKLDEKNSGNTTNTDNSDKNDPNSTSKKEKLDSKNEEKTDSGLPSLRPILINGKKIETPKNQEDIVQIQLQIARDPKFKVISKTQKPEKSNAKPPFITSSLQQAASSMLGFGPKITMQLAQKLYEGTEINGKATGLITYMRTDSFNLSGESVESCRQFIKAKYPSFLPPTPNFYKSKKSAQEAHEAIRPTNPLLTPISLKNQLEPRLWKLYNLIWSQTMASQMTPEIRERISFELENSLKSRFAGSVYWTTSMGWKTLFDKEKSNERSTENLEKTGESTE